MTFVLINTHGIQFETVFFYQDIFCVCKME